MNHYSENSVNAYFSGIFQNDTELHKKLGIKTEDAKRFNIALGKQQKQVRWTDLSFRILMEIRALL